MEDLYSCLFLLLEIILQRFLLRRHFHAGRVGLSRHQEIGSGAQRAHEYQTDASGEFGERTDSSGPEGLPDRSELDAAAVDERRERRVEGAAAAQIGARDEPEAPARVDRVGTPRGGYRQTATGAEPRHEGLRGVSPL